MMLLLRKRVPSKMTTMVWLLFASTVAGISTVSAATNCIVCVRIARRHAKLKTKRTSEPVPGLKKLIRKNKQKSAITTFSGCDGAWYLIHFRFSDLTDADHRF